jgi:DNA primase
MKFKKGQRLHVSNVDVRALLESLNIDYKESGKNIGKGWIGVCCPFCQEGNYHLGIHIESKVISCWKCGQTGSIVSFISKEIGSFPKALEAVKEHIPRELRIEPEDDKTGVSEVVFPPNVKPGLSQYHKNYLISRGFNPEYLEDKYHLHHVGPVGKHKNRIIVPILKRMQLLTYTTIDIHPDSKSRYIHLEEELSIIPVKKLIYGDEYTDGHNCIVVEGIFDYWRIGDGACTVFGVKFTAEQKHKISRYANVGVLGDGDEQGWKFNRSLSSELSPFCNVKFFDLEEGVDPDKLTKEEINFIKGRLG